MPGSAAYHRVPFHRVRQVFRNGVAIRERPERA